MSVKIEDLDPAVQAPARRFLASIPIPNVVTSTRRFAVEQVARFLQGRGVPLWAVNLVRAVAGLDPIVEYVGKDGKKHSENDFVRTECDGVTKLSNHQGGKALDVCPADEHGNPVWPPDEDQRWEVIARAGEAAGFKPGRRWKKPDSPHYDWPG